MDVAALRVAARVIETHGGHAWAVGGCVRSLLLGQNAGDVDIAVGGPGSAEETDLAFTISVARLIAAALGSKAHVFTLDPDMVWLASCGANCNSILPHYIAITFPPTSPAAISRSMRLPCPCYAMSIVPKALACLRPMK